jgi:hypothetical protein
VFAGNFQNFGLRATRNSKYTSRQSPEGNHDSTEDLAKACPFMGARNHFPELHFSVASLRPREISPAGIKI